MRLYTRTGATQVSAGGRVYNVESDGSFAFPEAVGAELHGFHVDGKPAWEDDAERAARLVAEQQEKLRDPATLLAEVQKMGQSQGALTALLANALGVGAPAAAETAAPPAASAPTSAAVTEAVASDAPVAMSTRSRKAAASKSAAAPSA